MFSGTPNSSKKRTPNGCRNGTSPLGNLCEPAQSSGVKVELSRSKENGPKHAKSYDVMLSVDNKSYQEGGKNSNLAQTNAALKAMGETTLLNPSKTSKKKTPNPSSLTPTVKLNGLAMARGEIVKYEVVNRIPLPCQPIYRKSKKDVANMQFPTNFYGVPFQYGDMGWYGNMGINNYGFNPVEKPVQRWIYPHLFRIQVSVGERSFMGEGKTQQAARHDAAQKALDLLETMPIPIKTKKPNYKNDVAKDKNTIVLSESNDLKTVQNEPSQKSSISMLYEKASVHKLLIEFILMKEDGPPHLRSFQMKVIVRSNKHQSQVNCEQGVLIVAEAVGPNKKLAKAKAAFNALEKLDISVLPDPKYNGANSKKINKKEPISLHPVSRLAQIVQAKKESDPVYTVISETKVALRGMKFVMKCEAMGKTGEGEGASKRDAKRLAAENLLMQLGLLPKSIEAKTNAKNSSKGNVGSISQHSKLNSSRRSVMPTLVESKQELG